MKRLSVNIDDKIHKKLKVESAIKGVTITDFIQEFLNDYFKDKKI